MRLAPMKPILELAEERNVAYGAYVTVSYEMARAAIEAGSIRLPFVKVSNNTITSTSPNSEKYF